MIAGAVGAVLVAGHGTASADEPGRTPGALPGLVRVTAATPGASEPTVSTIAGYGYRGAVLDEEDAHHRASGALAFSIGAGDWLTAALRLDGRYDRHTDVPSGDDDGWVGDPRLTALARRELAGDLHVGAGLSLWFPGEGAPSVVPSATSIELSAISSWAPVATPVVVSTNLGFRLDRSAEAIDDPDALSLADRMSLGLSDANAVLFGVGVGYRVGRLELVGEWSWDLLVGDEAPSASASPMRAALGARRRLSDALLAQLFVEAGLSEAPAIARGMPLAPVEPRVSVMAGLQYRFGTAEAPRRHIEDVPPPPPPPPPPKLGGIRGRVTSTTGGPLPDAEVVIAAGGEERRVTTDADGNYQIDDLPVGTGQVRIVADEYVDDRREIEIVAGEEISIDVELEPQLPRGQLRGLVRSFRGEPLSATLVLKPSGTEVATDGEGFFEVDVPPGEYSVTVSADGYVDQEREVRIEERGVTILNVDLRRK